MGHSSWSAVRLHRIRVDSRVKLPLALSMEGVGHVDRGEAQGLVDLGREISGVAFAIYIGELPGAESARARLAELPDPDGTVLIAVDPERRLVDIVTGSYAMSRVDDHSCNLAVLSLQSCASAGDVSAGIRDALVLLAERARAPRVLHLDEPN
jgi:hypothetical protein